MNELNFQKKLFGGEIIITLYGIDATRGIAYIDQTYKEALRLEKIFNFFDPKSELSMLNHLRRKKVSPELLQLIQKALSFCQLSAGAYDISLGKQFLQRKNKEKVSLLGCSYKDIQIQGDDVALLHEDVLLDLGSIAKGYITDKIGEYLFHLGAEEFFIDSRGDILVQGNSTHALEIQDPRLPEEKICSVLIKNKGIATSGDYAQYHTSFTQSHILQQKELASVTVIADTLEEADVYATVLFVCEKKEREKLIHSSRSIKAMTVDTQGKINYYNQFEDLLQ